MDENELIKPSIESLTVLSDSSTWRQYEEIQGILVPTDGFRPI